ncbi:uncharacterized protein LOC131146395 [Malania oleifera]|uniref:uncharacterized protein LOC131146395 n=1 Tax=Malania oleifera TaxID=397392 RepID=UPI0025AE1E82|nr:uncharacterized protein LOC131146395 [Malania oleifera]
MMPCSKEALTKLFYNCSSSFQLLFLIFYASSILLPKLFNFLCTNPIFTERTQNGFEAGWSSEDEEVYEDFHADSVDKDDHNHTFSEEITTLCEPDYEDLAEIFPAENYSPVHGSPASDSINMEDEVLHDEEIPERNSDSVYFDALSEDSPTLSTVIHMNKNDLGVSAEESHDEERNEMGEKGILVEKNFKGDEKFLVFAPSQLETKSIQVEENGRNEDIFGDSYTIGSTSKSSSEWRSSTINRDSGTDDPFSSSSRRSCPKWESYTVFQKYDDEMAFLDRISAQKLHETELLRSIQVCPRSISERIVHKLATRNKSSSNSSHNPYNELEAAYVAQICLTWEALNWNYKNFQSKRASRCEFDPGCPAHVAQQFQQFQVLLQRYIENEPYEHGRRPLIYARMRKVAPKLLLVPEYRDSVEDEQKEDGCRSRISSASFLVILEDGIRTFMNFLKAERDTHHQLLKVFFNKRNITVSVDPTLLLLMKKANKKKKLKLKDLRRARKCIRKRRLNEEEEMEILMGLIDLKVVSRVLRMADLSEEQLQWCEQKMNKVRVWEGKLQRDSSPLFFPPH